MKLGILTLTPAHNYGGILQAVALYSYLKAKGYNVELINKVAYSPLWKKIIFYILEKIPFQNIKNRREGKIKARQLKPFLDQYIPNKTDPVFSLSDFRKLVGYRKYDAVIVGSDQVWRYTYINDGYYSTYFLDFGSDIKCKKIAYAASFGKDEWEEPGENKNISDLISDFDAVSTREMSGVNICKETFKFKGQVLCVLDPTMLIKPEFYDHIVAASSSEISKAGLVTYILDENKHKRSIVEYVKNRIDFDKEKEVHLGDKKRHGIFYKVEEWLSAIKNAEFVITDSFHGMVFSIVFNKQFLVIGNSSRGLSRFHSLLSALGLECRFVDESQNGLVLDEILENKIDYKGVNDRIDAMRDLSVCFLNRALQK